MAKKLEFDRTVRMRLKDGQRTQVPNGELWKITVSSGSKFDGYPYSAGVSHLLGSGTTISTIEVAGTMFAGIVFKVVEV